MPKPRYINYKILNRLLLAGIIIINLYVILSPLYPSAIFWWQKHHEHRPQQLTQLIKSMPAHPTNRPAEELIIPGIALDEKIQEGYSVYTVNKGVWHWPKGASPGQIGNTVLIGHRWTYRGPAVFAHLDLVKRGDPIVLVWDGRKVSYTVSDIKVVEPNDTSIIQPSKDKRLTIYTCTPMWTSRYRLAVIAEEDRS